MIDVIQAGIRDQFAAALMMLRNSIEHCEPSNWTKPVGSFAFWHVAYHTLFCTDLYLSAHEKAFLPQPFHRKGYEWFGKDEDTQKPVTVSDPYDKPTLLGYVDTCMKIMHQTVPGESEAVLRGESGFSWLVFPRLQIHLYNLRHLQHHVGQLTAFLNREQGKPIPWVRDHHAY